MTAYVRAFWIEALSLRDWIEHTKVRLRIATAAGGPLPAHVVLCEIAIREMTQEVRFAVLIVHEQVLREEARGDHARAVVNEALGEELACGRVDHRIAGRAGAPRVPTFAGACSR